MASPAAATRPPWLPEGPQLETFLEDRNRTWPLTALRADRNNNCGLVNSVLEQIVSTRNLPTSPTEFEMYWARTHLAVDLQGILRKWCAEGWERTMGTSPLKGFVAAACPPPPPIKHERYDVVVEDAEHRQRRESASPVPTGVPCSSGWTACNQPSVEGATASSSRTAFKRPLEDAEEYPGEFRRVTRVKTSSYRDKSKFTCPYHAMDATSHTECANKYFPNPRKLKEHVWRWLKPFKCPNCGEGFGREKTRAIHCDQRKTKCKKNQSTYEGSAEHRRDQKIESSKTTKEMIEIFQEYEREKHTHQSNAMTPPAFRDPPEERSPSPESQNDSQNPSNTSVSDGESDSGDQGYTGITSPTLPAYQGGGTIDQYTIPQRHGHVQEDGEVDFADKEAPVPAFEARRSSLPYSADDYHNHQHHQRHHQQQQQRAGGYPQLTDLRLPEIVITHPEPQMEGSPSRARSNSNSFARQQQQQQSYYPNSTRSQGSPVGMVPGYIPHRAGGLVGGGGETSNTSAIVSAGFGSFAPFAFAMSNF